MATLNIEKINKIYGGNQVLKDVNLQLGDGDFLVLVGPSGCGKSTLMNIVAGLDEASNGKVVLNGQDITHQAPADRNIAMVFQSYALYPHLSVEKNIAFPLKMRGVKKEQRLQRVAQVAELLQISHLLKRRPRELSGGQRQRVAMGRALARDPQLFLFDEPLSNLDAKLRVDMRIEIKRLHERTGVTTIYVTHDQVEAMTLGSRIAVLKGGVLQQVASPMDLYNQPANLFVASFIGSPAINQVPGKAINPQTVKALGVDFHLPRAFPLTSGQDVVLAFRPEHLRLDSAGPIATTLLVQEPTGAEDYLRLSCAQEELSARLAGHHNLTLHEALRFSINPSALLLFDPQSENRLNPVA